MSCLQIKNIPYAIEAKTVTLKSKVVLIFFFDLTFHIFVVAITFQLRSFVMMRGSFRLLVEKVIHFWTSYVIMTLILMVTAHVTANWPAQAAI